MSEQFLGIDNKFIVVDGSIIVENVQSKNVFPSSVRQIVIPDSGYIGLDSVTVEAVATEEKIVTLTESQQIIVPTSGKFLSKVTVDGIYAIINVAYPEGSTCTCTDGTKMLNLKDTSGQGFFLIPYAATWTVICYDGADYDSSENKKSEVVEITTEGQSESVGLSYIYYLIKNGVVQNGLTIETKKGSTTPSISTGDGFLSFYTPGWYNGIGTGAFYFPKMDLTKYSKLCIEYVSEKPGWADRPASYSNCMGLNTLVDANYICTDKYASVVFCTNAEKTTAELDISNITGADYFIATSVMGLDTNISNTMNVYNWWLG